MAKRKPQERQIFFPWEKRGGLLRRIRVDQLQSLVVLAIVLGGVLLIGMHERRTSGIRRTRATLLGVRETVDSYMADHDGGCPKDGLAGVEAYAGEDKAAPQDAWGKPLRLTCPGRERARYDLSSDGPDGVPGGLDRIE
ncbi:MAG TPA: type II secretion system protein GspG [Polyangiaceae bacterium]|nr:type II secretion system protein GspG [Polyangiaceae bacterium]